jgi:serine protease Do
MRDDSTEPEPRRSSGSGFIIDPAGVIVTNAHVVEDVESAQVRLLDGRRFTAKVIGRDDRVDLALLRIDGAKDLPTLRFGDANRVRVGEFVLALGHPFGLEHTVSFGIVSRKGAPLTVAAPGFDFIQTDAAINPGNSGGPLVNMAGEVIGVNTMAARNGSIGFAIPSNLVQTLVPQLATKGHVEWGWLGVSITEIPEDDLVKLKLQDPRGVLIRSVMPGEPADQGGVKPNDVILALDGTKLEGPRDLQRIVAAAPVGKKIRVTLLRDGREQDVEVTIGRYMPRDTK